MNLKDTWSPSRAAAVLITTALAGLAITWAGYDSARRVAASAAEERFKFARAETISAIETRMHDYEMVLRSTKSLFSVKSDISRTDWHSYLQGLQLDLQFPGTQGVGYSLWLTPEDVPAYEARIRAEGFPDFAISPPGQRREYTSITFIEPMDERNRQAFGYDMWSHEIRRQAMWLARDRGQIAMSGPVKLVQEIDANVQPGVLVYLPHYDRPLAELLTVNARREALVGFVYSVFRMGDLMAGILGPGAADAGPNIGIALFDTDGSKPENLLYRSPGGLPDDAQARGMLATDTINIYGREWQLVSHSMPSMLAPEGSVDLAAITVMGGTTTTIFILLLLGLALNTRRRAHYIATAITRDLDQRTEELSKALTRQEAIEEELRHTITTDPLTGLYNRAAFNDWLHEISTGWESAGEAGGSGDRQRGSSTGHGILMMDIDRFKAINDTLGHVVGDDLLRGIGKRLRTALGGGHRLARIGGDEFALVTADTDSLEASRALADRIIGLLTEPVRCNDRPIKATCSIGIAFMDQAQPDPQRCMAHADLALYRAKSVGRNTSYVFDAKLEADVVRRAAIEEALDGALERGEFHLEYQPKLDANGGKVIGAEVLLRWVNPTLGFVPPDVFIPTAEETGHIAEISDWVLETACAQVRKWHDDGLIDFALAINLSAQQIQSSKLVETITGALERHQVSPQMIELEITESMLIDDFEMTAKQLKQLREHGVRIAIDDFGTGYSSLSYLHRLEVDVLKIDRSFVGSLETPQSRSIITSIIGLARTLRLHTVAEGVETVEQAQFLRANGCDEMQGWLFSRSLKADDFAAWIRKGTNLPLSAKIATGG